MSGISRLAVPEVGRSIVLGSWWGTGVFVVTAVAGVVAPSWFEWPALGVALLLFAIGIVTMLWAFLGAVGRSRHELIGIGGLYFGAGSAPGVVRVHLLVALGVQIVAGVATASARLFTAAAFGTLVPIFGVGMTGLWVARHGRFPRRDEVARPNEA